MPFRTVCRNCQAAYKLPDTMNGKKVRCAKCQNSMVAVETAELVDDPAEVEAVAPSVPSSARKVKPSREPDYEEERDIDDEEDSDEGERPRKRSGAKVKKRGKKSSESQSKIAAVAFNQKAMLLCILANFVAGLLWKFLPPELGLLCLLPMLLVGIASTVFVFMLAAALYGTGLGIFIGILTLPPGVGLITLLVMNQKATKFLRDNGLEVGFLGAKAPSGTKPLISPRLLGMIAGVVLVVVCLGAAGAYLLTRDPDGPWPEVQMAPLRGPGNEILEDVMVHVAGVTDDYNAGIITRKLARLADPPNNKGMISAKKGDRITARVTSTDPQATAKKIDFGTVRKVSGRVITVDAKPVEVPAENDEIGKALYDIRGPFAVPRREAFKRLRDIKPNARRDEVVKELTKVIPETEPEDRRFAIEALTAWGGENAQ